MKDSGVRSVSQRPSERKSRRSAAASPLSHAEVAKMAAAANPSDFLALHAADLQRFRAGCKGLVVAALRYRTQNAGRKFYATRVEIRHWCKNAYSTRAVDYALAQLRDEKFISTRSDGRGFFVEVL